MVSKRTLGTQGSQGNDSETRADSTTTTTTTSDENKVDGSEPSSSSQLSSSDGLNELSRNFLSHISANRRRNRQNQSLLLANTSSEGDPSPSNNQQHNRFG
eukprot:7253009-Ditylum_brightwellii.AAC.1